MSLQVFQPKFDIENCLKEIRECLEKGWTGMGYKTVQFENIWKEYTGLSNAYFVNSATAALNLTFDILKTENGWQADDEVITTPLTFVSTNHAIKRVGLHPVFADVDDTLCLDPESVRSRITEKTRAVCYVGMGGNTGNYEEIVKICEEHSLALILDAAHMAGTKLNGKIPGIEADAVCYSFQAVKNLPTGDSGMVCFKKDIYDRLARQRGWLGISKDTYARMNNGNYKWKYDVDYIGNKYNGNALTAAVAIAQFEHLEEGNAYRRYLAGLYKEKLRNIRGVSFVSVPDNCISSQHLFQILVDQRDELIMYLSEYAIFPGVHYTVNTDYPMYAYGKGTCPHAEWASRHVLTLPAHLNVTEEDVENVCERIRLFQEDHERGGVVIEDCSVGNRQQC